MTTAVAIVNWNSGYRLRSCIESLLATKTNAEILIVDNASTDGSLEAVEGFRNHIDIVRNSVNRGFAAAVNQAFQSTTTSCVLILNPDVQVMPGAVQLLEEFLNEHLRAGAAGGYVGEKYLPRRLPTVSTLIRENLGMRVSQTDAEQPAAAALMIRRDAYDEIGGFDERFYPAWYEDVDFCQRLKETGWEIYFVPEAEFVHSGGYSARALGVEGFTRSYYSNQARYAQKHFGAFGSAVVRASIAVGMVGRMICRPKQAAAYAKVLIGALRGW